MASVFAKNISSCITSQCKGSSGYASQKKLFEIHFFSFPFQCIRVKKWFKASCHYFRAKQLNVLYRNIKTIYASNTQHFFNGFQIKQFIYAINNNMQFLIISR